MLDALVIFIAKVKYAQCLSLSKEVGSFSYESCFFTGRKRSLRRLCFYTRLSVIVFRGGTWSGTPPGPGTPPWDQVLPPDQAPPRPGTPAPDQVHPPRPGTPSEQYMLGDTGNRRAVRILLECMLVFSIFQLHERF